MKSQVWISLHTRAEDVENSFLNASEKIKFVIKISMYESYFHFLITPVRIFSQTATIKKDNLTAV